MSEIQSEAGGVTGFIPCEFHAKEVVSGARTLESLIQNRIAKHEFPNFNETPENMEAILNWASSQQS